VNLILNRSAVIELIQDSLTEKSLRHHLKDLLKTSNTKKIEKEYLALKTILGKGGASSKTAQLIFDKLRKSL
jgi:lipid A disaccharide synthetase